MSASVRGLLPVVALAALSSTGLAAQAVRVPSAVRVAPSTCATPPVSLLAFIGALRVELAGAGIRCCDGDPPHAPGGEAPLAKAAVVRLAFETCQPTAGHVSVSVEDSAGGQGLRREVDLDDVGPEARPRALALVVAELVGAHPSAGPPPVDPAVAPPPAATTAASVPAPAGVSLLGGLQLGADLALHFYPARDTTLPGARLWLSAALRSWVVEGGVGAATGSHRYDPGTVTVRSLSAGLTAGPRWTWGESVAGAGIGADVGWTWIAGQSTDPGVGTGSGSGVIGAVRARLSIDRAIGRSVRVRAVVDGGFMVAPVDSTVDDVRAAGTSGLFVLAGLGVGYALGH